MPQNGAQSSAQSPVSLPIDLSGLRRLVESLTAVYPSVYRGGFVHLEQVDKPSILLASIVCQTEYSHLSPEELRFRDLNINSNPARWELSYEETRLRYYLDEGITSFPQFGPPTPAPAFSVSSGVKSTSSVSAVPNSRSNCFGLGCPIPVHEEPATSLCCMCASKLSADAANAKEDEATSEGLGRETPTPSNSRHSDTRCKKKLSRIRRRVRRLEKTVESLSHGLILALTELKDTRGHTTSSSTVEALSTALSGVSTEVDLPDNTSEASAPDVTALRPSEQPDPTKRRESTSLHTSTRLGDPSGSGESKSDPTAGVAKEKHCSIPLRKDRSPISGLLKLDFMTCPEVFRFLKWAEAHPGLKSTQLFDLLWVSDNLFNVHGGILIYCLQKSFIPMDAISGATGSSAWSQVPELMQKLDDTYCKHLRLHIETDGSRNSVAKAAWESYCLELGRIFSERFPDWESAIPFFQNLSREYDCIGPMITSSYIEDLSTLWTEVHPALLEVSRWLEPFIAYEPDYHCVTPLHDATITLGRHARELFNRNQQGGLKEPTMFSTMRANNLMRLLCEHRSGDLKNMQRELSVVITDVSGNFDTDELLVERAKHATLWRATEPSDAQMQDALARREVRAMMGYRPQLLRAGTAAARIRSDVLDVLVQTGRWVEGGELIGERGVFWDGL